jgi:hypothetical protein
VLPGNTACSKCQANGLAECPPQEPPKDTGGKPSRGLSAPPDRIGSAVPESRRPTDQHAPAATKHQPQCIQSRMQTPPSGNVVDPPATRGQRTQSTSQQPLHETTGPFKSSTPNYLASISEFDELYDSPVFIQDSAVDYDSTGPDIDIYGADAPNYSSNTLNSHTDNFFMTLAATDRYGSEETENFNMNVSGTEEEDGFEARGRNKDGSEDENSVLALSMEELYVRRPQAAINKCTKP